MKIDRNRALNFTSSLFSLDQTVKPFNKAPVASGEILNQGCDGAGYLGYSFGLQSRFVQVPEEMAKPSQFIQGFHYIHGDEGGTDTGNIDFHSIDKFPMPGTIVKAVLEMFCDTVEVTFNSSV